LNQLLSEGKYLALGSLKFYRGMNVPNIKNACNCVIAGDGGNFVSALFYVAPSITIFFMLVVE
jgi:hypothetical protein